MKSRTWSLTAASVILAAFTLPAATRACGDETLAAIQSGKQKRISLCRARYRDCLSRNQIPSFECRYIYHDCINHIV
jgi:hypothetical protein